MAESLQAFLKYARQLPNLTKSEEQELARRRDLGDEAAKHRLIEHNVRLAVKMAREWQGCGLPFDDLVQEACVGLSIAAEKFNPEKGRFTTYATQWIRKSLWEAGYGQSNTIKRPSQLSRTVVKVYEHMSNNPSSTIDEMAEALGLSADTVREAIDHGRVVASTDEQTFREVGAEELEEISSIIELLDRDEREAVSWRYGLYGEECSIEIVAERMTQDKSLPGKFTPQEAGKLCRAAVRKLRAARFDDQDEIICEVG